MLLVNYFDLAELYLNDLSKNKIAVKDILSNEIDNYKKLINAISEKFTYKVESEVKNFEPVIQWAQKKDYVIIEIKLSDNFHSPACTNLENEFIDILTHGLELSGFCSQSGDLKKYYLKLNFFDEIFKLNSNHNFLEDGRYIIYLRKKTPIEWDFLTKAKSEIKMWQEMQDKFDEEEDKEEEKEVVEEKPKKKKSRKTKYVIRGKEYKDSFYE